MNYETETNGESATSSQVETAPVAKKARKMAKAKKAVKKAAKPARKVAKAKVKKTAKAKGNGGTRGTAHGTYKGDNKVEAVRAKMRSAKGITRAEILAMTGWKAVNPRQLVPEDKIKSYKISNKERPFTYHCK